MADDGLQIPLFVLHIEHAPIPLFTTIENTPVPVTSSLVLYSDWFKQTEIVRKFGQAFRYMEIKESVENQADNIVNPYGLKSRLLPNQTVGVQGDYRTYKFVLMIESPSGDIFENYEILQTLSTRLTNEISEINRIVLLAPHQSMSDNEIFIDDYFLKDY